MKLCLITTTLLMAQAVAAQTQTRIFEMKHVTTGEVSTLLSAFDARIRMSSDKARVLAVTATPETMSAIEQAIKRLDVPPPVPKNVELTLYMALAGDQIPDSGKMPPELEPVAKQLRNVFPYKSYHLLESFQVRGRDGQTVDTSGVAPSPYTQAEGARMTYNFKSRISVAASEKGDMIRIDALRFSLRVPVATGMVNNTPTNFQFVDAGVFTDIDVRDGQKVVVGKAAVGGQQSSRSAIFLIVSGKVVD